MANKSNVNIYSLLQSEGTASSSPEGPRTGKAAAAVVVGQAQTPAEKAAIRAKANAEKAAVADAAKQRADADAAAAALVGPLEGFVTQKSSAPKKDRDTTKKLSREDYAKKPQDGTAPRKNFDNKKPYVKRDGESGGKPYVKDDRRREGKPAGTEGTGNRPPRREFDKHSAGKTGNKFQNKRQGDGAANWGNAVTDAKNNAATDATWGDEGQTTKVDAKDALWGDEGVPTEAADETKVDADEKKEEAPAKPAVAAWDDEGFGKMTLQEHQKAEADRVAKLNELTGQKERRAADAVDLNKFQLKEKDTTDEKEELLKKQKKQEAKKAAGAARTGEKAVGLNDLFSVRGQGRGPRPDGDRPRGPRPDGDRPPRTEGEQGQRQPRAPRVNPNNTKQFPDLGGKKTTKPQHVK